MAHITSARRFVLLLTGAIIMLVGCSTDPLTNRSRPMLITQSKEAEMGRTAFHKLLNDPAIVVIADGPSQQRVSQIFIRLVDAAKRSVHEDLAKQFEWEVALISNDRKADCFSLPGGKIGIYTGMLSYAFTDDELAGALGHSIATVLARHGGERMSRSVLSQIAMLGTIGAPTEQKKEDPALDRKLKAEADRIGLLLVADAGYDPDEAFQMWVKSFGLGPRLDALREYLPEARTHYNASRAEVPPLIDPK